MDDIIKSSSVLNEYGIYNLNQSLTSPLVLISKNIVKTNKNIQDPLISHDVVFRVLDTLWTGNILVNTIQPHNDNQTYTNQLLNIGTYDTTCNIILRSSNEINIEASNEVNLKVNAEGKISIGKDYVDNNIENYTLHINGDLILIESGFSFIKNGLLRTLYNFSHTSLYHINDLQFIIQWKKYCASSIRISNKYYICDDETNAIFDNIEMLIDPKIPKISYKIHTGSTTSTFFDKVNVSYSIYSEFALKINIVCAPKVYNTKTYAYNELNILGNSKHEKFECFKI